MSMKLTAQAMGMRVGNPLRKLVLLKLCDNANDKGQCWPSVSYIADQCEISTRSVLNHIAALQDAGFLVIKQRSSEGKKLSNFYIINLDNVPQKVIHSNESPAYLKSVSSESPARSSESPALLSSESPAHRISHSLNQSIIQPLKIYKKIDLENLPEWVSELVAKKFVDHCERVGKKLSQEQFDSAMLEALGAPSIGLTPDQVILECVDAGWKSVKVQWVYNRLFGVQGGAPQVALAVPALPVLHGADFSYANRDWAK